MSLSRVKRFRFFFFPHLFPKLTMPLRVAIVLLCPKLLMTYSSNIFFALWTLLLRSPFLLARSTGKQRLTSDLRHVNGLIYKQQFKCENLSVATQIFGKDYYLFKFVLKAGYHFIEVFPKHRKYCRAFAWDFGSGKFRFFQFCVLSFRWPFIYSFYLHQDSQAALAVQLSRLILIYSSLVSSQTKKSLFGNQFKL